MESRRQYCVGRIYRAYHVHVARRWMDGWMDAWLVHRACLPTDTAQQHHPPHRSPPTIPPTPARIAAIATADTVSQPRPLRECRLSTPLDCRVSCRSVVHCDCQQLSSPAVCLPLLRRLCRPPGWCSHSYCLAHSSHLSLVIAMEYLKAMSASAITAVPSHPIRCRLLPPPSLH